MKYSGVAFFIFLFCAPALQAQWNTLLQTAPAAELRNLEWSKEGRYLLGCNEQEAIVCDAVSGLKVKHLIPKRNEKIECILPAVSDSQFYLVTHASNGLMKEAFELKRYDCGTNSAEPVEVLELNELIRWQYGDTILYRLESAFLNQGALYMQCTFYGKTDLKSIYSNYMHGLLVFDIAGKKISSLRTDSRNSYAPGFGIVNNQVCFIGYDGTIISYTEDGEKKSDKIKAEILDIQFNGDTVYCILKDASVMKLIHENGSWKEFSRTPPPFAVWANDLDGVGGYPFCVNAKGEVMIKYRKAEGLETNICSLRKGRWKTERCKEGKAAITMHPSGRYCVSASRNALEAWTVATLDAVPGYLQLTELNAFDKVIVAASHHLLLASSRINGIYAFTLDKVGSSLISDDFINDICIHPGERFFYASHGGDVMKIALPGMDTLQRLRLWPSERNDLIPGGNYRLSISADGRYLLSQYSREHKIAVWDCYTNALLHVIPLKKKKDLKGDPVIYDCRLNSDGRYALIKTGDSYNEDAYQLVDINAEKILEEFPLTWEGAYDKFDPVFRGTDSLLMGTHVYSLTSRKELGVLPVLKQMYNAWFRPASLLLFRGAYYYTSGDTLYRFRLEEENIEKLGYVGPYHYFTFDSLTGHLYAIREGVSVDVIDGVKPIASLYCKPVHSWEVRKNEKHRLLYCWLDNEGNFTGDKDAFELITYQQGSTTIPSHLAEYEFNRADVLLKSLGHATAENVTLYRKLYEKRKSFITSTLPARIEKPVTYSFPVSGWNPLTYLDWDGIVRYTLPEDGMQMNVMLNGIPLETAQYKITQEGRTGKIKFRISLNHGNNYLELLPLNARNEIVSPQSVFIYNNLYTGQKTLAIGLGVSHYQDSAFNLKYPVHDVNSILQLYSLDTGNVVKSYLNASVTAHVFDSIQQYIQRITVEKEIENFVLFYAGHGLVDKKGNYFLATADIDFKKPEGKGLAYDSLEKFLSRIPFRNKMVLIDACNSGLIDKNDISGIAEGAAVKEGRGSELLSVPEQPANFMEILEATYSNSRYASGAFIIGASGGLQYALESSSIQHGYFTYSILEAFAGYADADADGYLQSSELKEYVNRRVGQLSGGKQKPSSRAENALNNFTLLDKSHFLINVYFEAAQKDNVNQLRRLSSNELINPNITDPTNGFTALHYASRENAPLAIWYLIHSGTNPLQGSTYGWTPLDLAVRNNNRKAVVMLLSETRPEYALVALQQAERNTTDEAMMQLLKSPQSSLDKWRVFHKSIFSILNREPMDSFLKDEISSVLNYHSEAIAVSLLGAAVLSNNLDAAKMLLDMGADVNYKMGSGITALYFAVFGNNEQMVRLLMTHHANPNLPLPNGRTAIDMAKEKGNNVIIRLLLGD